MSMYLFYCSFTNFSVEPRACPIKHDIKLLHLPSVKHAPVGHSCAQYSMVLPAIAVHSSQNLHVQTAIPSFKKLTFGNTDF